MSTSTVGKVYLAVIERHALIGPTPVPQTIETGLGIVGSGIPDRKPAEDIGIPKSVSIKIYALLISAPNSILAFEGNQNESAESVNDQDFLPPLSARSPIKLSLDRSV